MSSSKLRFKEWFVAERARNLAVVLLTRREGPLGTSGFIPRHKAGVLALGHELIRASGAAVPCATDEG